MRRQEESIGAVRSHTGGSTEFSFTGEQNDPNGLEYLRARYYDPATGRFVSRDRMPVWEYDSANLNRYVYVRNNPVNGTDPTGLINIDDYWGGGVVGLALMTAAGAPIATAAGESLGGLVVYAIHSLFEGDDDNGGLGAATSSGQGGLMPGGAAPNPSDPNDLGNQLSKTVSVEGRDVVLRLQHVVGNLDGVALDDETVWNAITEDLRGLIQANIDFGGEFYRWIDVNGISIEYRVYVDLNGTIYVNTFVATPGLLQP